MAVVIIGVPLIFSAIETRKILIVTGIIKRLEITTKRLKNMKRPINI
jgi:hypothetical protein